MEFNRSINMNTLKQKFEPELSILKILALASQELL